ncbi:MAG: hypothetical protein M3Z92_02150 [Bacteroidota bacterium]|nr:hypothetical protein [Bacteroidota bacterium]
MKHLLFPKGITKQRTLFFPMIFSLLLFACHKEPGGHGNMYNEPKPNTNNVPPLHGMLDRSKIVMKSAIWVDLDRDVARIPLYKGYAGDGVVWYVRTDVSNEGLANKLGLNFAPRLVNADKGCASCIQAVTSSNPVPGKAPVYFVGTVDFTPLHQLTPSATGFPPLSVMPGSVAGPGYSDLIRVNGSHVVYNAPIVAVGTGPFDVSEAHTNTMDRVIAIDTIHMTVDLQFIRAFAFGKDIFYFSFSATQDVSATIESATLVPAMGAIPAPNQDDNPQTARSEIFAFANGKLGLNDPNVQGLNHVILDNAPGNFSIDNPARFETFRQLGDARNILGSFTTVKDKAQRELYTPLWDLNVAKWSDAVVAAGKNYAQTDGSTIQQLARHGLITNPDGTPLSSTGFIVNCPILGFATTAPEKDQAPPVE